MERSSNLYISHKKDNCIFPQDRRFSEIRKGRGGKGGKKEGKREGRKCIFTEQIIFKKRCLVYHCLSGLHYGIAFPFGDCETGRCIRMSPIFPKLKAAGAVFGQVMGYERPSYFDPAKSLDSKGYFCHCFYYLFVGRCYICIFSFVKSRKQHPLLHRSKRLPFPVTVLKALI